MSTRFFIFTLPIIATSSIGLKEDFIVLTKVKHYIAYNEYFISSEEGIKEIETVFTTLALTKTNGETAEEILNILDSTFLLSARRPPFFGIDFSSAKYIELTEEEYNNKLILYLL